MITAVAVARLGALVVVAVALTLCAGCGSSGRRTSAKSPPPASSSPGGAGSGPQTIPTPAPTGVPPDPAAVRVIRAWSSACAAATRAAPAAYFALPSVMVNGVGSNGALSVTAIRTRVAADAANASLPCGARFISADQRGRYVVGTGSLDPETPRSSHLTIDFAGPTDPHLKNDGLDPDPATG